MKRICLNQSVLDFMASVITPQSYVLEFGAGWSSRWFADRCGRLMSVESNPNWTRRVEQDLKGARAQYELRDTTDNLPGDADLVLIDSSEVLRLAHLQVGWEKLKMGGWLVFDDAQRECHAESVAFMERIGPLRRLEWDEAHDIPEARERLALAVRKPGWVV